MLGKGRLDEAILYFKKALHTAPAYGNAYRNLGDAYLRKGDFGRAISSYKSALIYGNQEVHLYNNMGVALTCLGRYEEAMKQFERVLMEKPDDALAAANLRKIGAGMAKRTSDGMKSGADAKRGRE
jgi:tetratricopeptide (TPR) repeat protein